MNEPDDECMSMVHWAAYHGHPKHMRMILKKKPNLLATDVEGKTALHWCSSHKGMSRGWKVGDCSHTATDIIIITIDNTTTNIDNTTTAI